MHVLVFYVFCDHGFKRGHFNTPENFWNIFEGFFNDFLMNAMTYEFSTRQNLFQCSKVVQLFLLFFVWLS